MQNAHDIAEALGLKRSGRAFVGDCPACGYHDGLTVRDYDGDTLFHCFGCHDQAAVLDAFRRAGLWSGETRPDWTPPPPRHNDDERAERSKAAAVEIWSRTLPAVGTVVEQYIVGRVPGLTGIPPTLRFARLKHSPTGLTLPVMVAGVTVWPSRKVEAVHRTYLTEGGKKAPVTQPKMSLGPIACGAVRLAPHGRVLIVGEGIESVLSAMIGSGLPGWAALSTGGLRTLILPYDVSEVLIAADHDQPGLDAAQAAAARWEDEGRCVKIAVPPTPGHDFNDFLGEAA